MSDSTNVFNQIKFNNSNANGILIETNNGKSINSSTPSRQKDYHTMSNDTILDEITRANKSNTKSLEEQQYDIDICTGFYFIDQTGTHMYTNSGEVVDLFTIDAETYEVACNYELFKTNPFGHYTGMTYLSSEAGTYKEALCQSIGEINTLKNRIIEFDKEIKLKD